MITDRNIIKTIERLSALWEPAAPSSKAMLKSALQNQETLETLADLEHWNEYEPIP
jgi:hypothetical protein